MSTRTDHGFTITELITIVAVMGILMGIAIPTTLGMSDSMKLDAATRDLDRELQSARLRAVTSNRPFRVHLNCPEAGQLRTVEVTGVLAVDIDSDRCSEAAYPYPSPKDTDMATPEFDGPVRYVNPRVTLSPAAPALVLQFSPDGRVATVSGSGVATPINGSLDVSVALDAKTKVINVNALGKIQLQ